MQPLTECMMPGTAARAAYSPVSPFRATWATWVAQGKWSWHAGGLHVQLTGAAVDDPTAPAVAVDGDRLQGLIQEGDGRERAGRLPL